MANDTPFAGVNLCEERELIDRFGITIEMHERQSGQKEKEWKYM